MLTQRSAVSLRGVEIRLAWFVFDMASLLCVILKTGTADMKLTA